MKRATGIKQQKQHYQPDKRIRASRTTDTSPDSSTEDYQAPPSLVSANSSFATDFSDDNTIDYAEVFTPKTPVQSSSPSSECAAAMERHAPNEYAQDSLIFFSELQFRFYEPSKQVKFPAHRQSLVEWAVEAGDDLQLSSDAIFLAVALMDRVLADGKIKLVDMDDHLFALACLLLASKFEDVAPPSNEHVLDQHVEYTPAQLLRAENQMLGMLKFTLLTATAKPFLRRVQRVLSAYEVQLSDYLAELSLTAANDAFVCFTPSLVAAAAAYTAVSWNRQRSTRGCCWTKDMEDITGYSAADLSHCSALLCKAFRTAKQKRSATYIKYANALHRVSTAAFDRVAPVVATSSKHHARSITEGGH